MLNTLFLFLYHKDNLVTKINYSKLCKVEGKKNVQPISDCQSYLNNTYRADEGGWTFPHSDSYWMCDGLIYKYVLNNKETILSREAVIIIEYDTWWNFPCYKWLPECFKEYDVVGAELLQYNKNSWEFFTRSSHLSFANELIGLRPFSVICCKPESIIKAAEYVQNNQEFHNLYNNEMRFATACKLSGSRVGEISFSFKKNIKWHEHKLEKIQYKEEIFHPVKKINHFK